MLISEQFLLSDVIKAISNFNYFNYFSKFSYFNYRVVSIIGLPSKLFLWLISFKVNKMSKNNKYNKIKRTFVLMWRKM